MSKSRIDRYRAVRKILESGEVNLPKLSAKITKEIECWDKQHDEHNHMIDALKYSLTKKKMGLISKIKRFFVNLYLRFL